MIAPEQRDELETWAGADGGELIRAALDAIDAQEDELGLLRRFAYGRYGNDSCGCERCRVLIEWRAKYGAKS